MVPSRLPWQQILAAGPAGNSSEEPGLCLLGSSLGDEGPEGAEEDPLPRLETVLALGQGSWSLGGLRSLVWKGFGDLNMSSGETQFKPV